VAIVYVLLDPETRKIRYVGSTREIGLRMRVHWSSRLHPDKPVAKWIKEINQKPPYDVLQEVPDHLQFEAESYWIKLLNEVPSVDLLNVVGARHLKSWGVKKPEKGRPHTPEARIKIGQSNKKSIRNRFTADQIEEIRLAEGTMKSIGDRYGIGASSVRRIKLGEFS